MIDPKKRKAPGNRPIMHDSFQMQTTEQHTGMEEHRTIAVELNRMPQENIDMPLMNRPDMEANNEQLIEARNEPNLSANRAVERETFQEFSPLRRVRKSNNNKLTAMLQVRNEQGRYLEEVLQDLSEFVDEIVIVDDASTDGTADVCRAFAKVVRLDVLEKPLFAEEWRLRNTLWQAAVSTCPDWLLAVDADELYSTEAKQAIRKLIDQDYADWFAFRFYDMWGGRTHYREDELWSLHKRHTTSLVRYMPGYPYFYPQQNHHVPRLPVSCTVLSGVCTELKVQHLGWAGSLEDRVRKYLRYKRIDPHGEWGNPAQYESILDPEPRLLPWKEGP